LLGKSIVVVVVVVVVVNSSLNSIGNASAEPNMIACQLSIDQLIQITAQALEHGVGIATRSNSDTQRLQ